MASDVPKFIPAHPPEWEGDLNPHDLAGENHGAVDPHPGKASGRTAADVKSLHERLPDLSNDDLKQIPLVPEGARLLQGATYLDLAGADHREFTATAESVAAPGTLYVAKSEVGYTLWNRLIGVQNPSRLDQADGSEAALRNDKTANEAALRNDKTTQMNDKTAGEASQMPDEQQRAKGGMPGDGKGRVDETGRSGVYPVSASAGASGSARIQGEASWGQGDEGARGYEDHGSSETMVIPPE